MINGISFTGSRQEIIAQGLKEAEKNKHNYTGIGKVYSQKEQAFAQALQDEATELQSKVKTSKAEYFSPFSLSAQEHNSNMKELENAYANAHGNHLNIIA